MKRPAAQRLKVFQAQIGFYDTVVAAPSQAAALRAWGIRQNLFANGNAQTTQELGIVAAALKYPETPLRRAVGTNAPFQLEPTSLPKIPDAPKRQPEKPKTKMPQRPKADRTELAAAEHALHELNESRKQAEAAFNREVKALEARQTAAQATYVEKLKNAAATIEAELQKYREEGGIE